MVQQRIDHQTGRLEIPRLENARERVESSYAFQTYIAVNHFRFRRGKTFSKPPC